jgi:predicted peptidase
MMLTNAALLAGESPAPGKQVGVTFQSPTDQTQKLNYLLFLPKDYGEPGKKWPLMIFLHGAGECGDNLELVKIHGPPKLVEKRPDDFPFIVASPQAPNNDVPIIDRWDGRLLSQFLDHLLETDAADADRVYLTGLSMGGFGSFRWAAREPKRFAAVVPICGGGWALSYAKPLKDVPLWIFHGDQDFGVPVRLSQEMAQAIREEGGEPKLTIYEGVGHDSWTATYDNPEVYKWLLSHKLSDRKPPEKK